VFEASQRVAKRRLKPWNIGANGVSWPPGKMDEKLKSENMQKGAVFYVYVIF